MSSDSGSLYHAGDFKSTSTGNTTKFAIIRNHIVVASIGTANITHGADVPYDFLTWIKRVDSTLTSTSSVDDVTDTIAKESSATFNGFDNVLTKGFLKQAKPLESYRLFIQYVIAGYVKGAPKVNVVQYYIDWDAKKLIGPKRIALHTSGTQGNFVSYGFGISQAIEDVSNTHSFAYQQVAAQCPAFKQLLDRHSISLDDASGVAHAFIKVEERTNPTEVFGDVATIRLLPDGNVSKLETTSRNVLCKQGVRKAGESTKTQPKASIH